MAVVIAQYFKPNQKPKAAAKENVKYIQLAFPYRDVSKYGG
jgi:hypothetical protein